MDRLDLLGWTLATLLLAGTGWLGYELGRNVVSESSRTGWVPLPEGTIVFDHTRSR